MRRRRTRCSPATLSANDLDAPTATSMPNRPVKLQTPRGVIDGARVRQAIEIICVCCETSAPHVTFCVLVEVAFVAYAGRYSQPSGRPSTPTIGLTRPPFSSIDLRS